MAIPAFSRLADVAVVIGRECADVSADAWLDVVAGFTVMDDWSARDLQRREMALNLGPAKGKDFATSLGPVVVTLHGTSYVVTYYRAAAFPQQLLTKSHSGREDEGARMTQAWSRKFRPTATSASSRLGTTASS